MNTGKTQGLRKVRNLVILTQAGIQDLKTPVESALNWMPACAGMTVVGLLQTIHIMQFRLKNAL